MGMKIGKYKLNEIYHVDCLKGLKKLLTNSIDLVIADPPYGDNCSYGRLHKRIKNNENPLLNCNALFELYRILKRNSSLYNFTNWKHYPFLVNFIMRYTKFKIRHLVVWRKGNIGMGYGFRNQYELILVLEKGNPKYALKNFSNVQETEVIIHNKQSHPHQKPKELITKIVEHSSKVGDIVLDPFVGSGAVPIVCKELGRNFIGFEISPKYVKVANESLRQQTLK